ncbi:uncharacterized protein Tco025E_03179 [Trypanosoma conorhini]|uniref:Uncharacterized protein n=1 Tax=Trypanosoma conorhini TaxID=83891 RepID=A0A422PXP3_9TRYP|nr:uncharacterized protein Tco025E_03179 [Trypanosoma conorhini]RNF22247.1 hypothetical protein Tco025E_03179 [Trypanosoma conorhini]
MDGQPALGGDFRNRNVTLIILYCFLDGACFSVWSAQLLPVLVNRLGGDRAVGWSAAASGIAQIGGATVAGYVGDKLPRAESIRTAFCCGILAVAATLVAVRLLTMPAIYITQALWGVYMGVASTSTEALFADSVPSGRRAFIYNFKWMVQTLCYCVGYAVALVMLLCMGNDWSVQSIQLVMTIGLAAHPLAHVVLLQLRDEAAPAQDEGGMYFIVKAQKQRWREGEGKQKSSNRQVKALAVTQESPLLSEAKASTADSESALSGQGGSGHHAGPPAANQSGPSREAEEQGRERERDVSGFKDGCDNDAVDEARLGGVHLSRRRIWVLMALPYLVCFTEFWMSVGAGMTVQYLTLFLVNDFGVTPTWLMASYITISCSTALCSTALRYVGEHFVGRLPAVITVRLIGTTFLFLLATAVGSGTPLAVVLVFFIARNAAMNSTMGVTRSVIMDCVSKSSRAKWSAFESFSSLTWAGSAVIGGYIAEAKGYQYTFAVTAVIHYVGAFILVPAAVAAHSMEWHLRQLKQAGRGTD